MELGFTLDLNAAKAASKGGRIGTGIYTVKIEKAYVYESKNGDPMIDLELRSKDGEVGFVNRLCMAKTWSTGSENFGYNIVQEIAGVVGAQTFTAVAGTRKRGEVEEPANQIKELVGKELKVATYVKFDAWDGKAKQELQLNSSYFVNGKTIEEAEKGLDATRIVKTSDKLADFYTDAHKALGNATTAAAPAAAPVETPAAGAAGAAGSIFAGAK